MGEAIEVISRNFALGFGARALNARYPPVRQATCVIKKNEVGRKYSIAYQKLVDKRIDECEKVIHEMKERDRFHCHRQEQLERVQKLFHELAEILESLQEN